MPLRYQPRGSRRYRCDSARQGLDTGDLGGPWKAGVTGGRAHLAGQIFDQLLHLERGQLPFVIQLVAEAAQDLLREQRLPIHAAYRHCAPAVLYARHALSCTLCPPAYINVMQPELHIKREQSVL